MRRSASTARALHALRGFAHGLRPDLGWPSAVVYGALAFAFLAVGAALPAILALLIFDFAQLHARIAGVERRRRSGAGPGRYARNTARAMPAR
jgi:hypothetical protein